MVFQVTVGGGQTIFPGDFLKSTFTLATSEVVLPDVIALTYQRAA